MNGRASRRHRHYMYMYASAVYAVACVRLSVHYRNKLADDISVFQRPGRVFCLLAKTLNILVKRCNFVFPVLQGSAEILIRRGGKLYYLSIAYFPLNTPAKHCCNPTTHTRVTTKNVG